MARFKVGDKVYHAGDDVARASDYTATVVLVHTNDDGAVSHPWDDGSEVWYLLSFDGCIVGEDDALTPESELIAHPLA